ncbi:flagellar assembly protein FliH [Psychrobium sp. nBUS_13]|uniref:flagellar assembly protein FliH n=1 Tax=Psychrobium sp. nBUS_13 TaxID=3395319 RepID=UPI003EBDC371
MSNEVYKPTDEELELLKRWYAPDVGKEVDKERTNAFRMNIADLSKPEPLADVVVDEEESNTLSAQALDEITQQAQEQGYQEGLAKGREEGLLKGHQEGYDQGLVQGIEDGVNQGLEQAQPQIAQRVSIIDAMITKLQQPLSSQDKAVEDALIELALTLAKKIVHVEITQSKKPIIQAVSEGIKVIGGESAVSLHVNPQDLDIIENLFGEQQSDKSRLTIGSDPALNIGDCYLNTTNSSVSLNLDERINQVFDDFSNKAAPEYESTSQVAAEHEQETFSSTDINENIPFVEEHDESNIQNNDDRLNPSSEDTDV